MKAVLIANRGEIAVRVARACREMGIRSVAVYSEADAGALHTRTADEAYLLGPAPARDSYLNMQRILGVARESRVDAIHPGYGLLSENAEFAAAVVAAGLVFIGPSPQVIATMGDKVAARAAALACGIPLLPGSDGPVSGPEQATAIARRIGYPVVVKACFGGGGRGMRVVHDESRLPAALQEAARESNAAFGRAEVYLEHYVAEGRHVEVQVLGDALGQVLHVGDRDCSVQRRHQKLIEEAPAPGLSDALREKLLSAAVRLAGSVGYRSAGTVEFLLDAESQNFYFLEMNTRLQVEHGVTELVSGIDLVQCQIRIARGEALGFTQRDVHIHGHAMQARIAAEDPWENFMPCPGKVSDLRLPLGPWLRLDFCVEAGDNVPGHYDSMFGKVQAWGPDRESARQRLSGALQVLRVGGLTTTAPYLRQVLQQADFIAVRHGTGSVERDWQPDVSQRPEPATAPVAVASESSPRSERMVRLSTSHGVIDVAVHGRARSTRAEEVGSGRSQAGAASRGRLSPEPVAPMEGTVSRILVKAGDTVAKDDVLAILEAMKMEMQVVAPRAGTVLAVLAQPGDVVKRGGLLVQLGAPPTAP